MNNKHAPVCVQGIDDLVHFDFMDPPAPETLMRALELLNYLGMHHLPCACARLPRCFSSLCHDIYLVLLITCDFPLVLLISVSLQVPWTMREISPKSAPSCLNSLLILNSLK